MIPLQRLVVYLTDIDEQINAARQEKNVEDRRAKLEGAHLSLVAPSYQMTADGQIHNSRLPEPYRTIYSTALLSRNQDILEQFREWEVAA